MAKKSNIVELSVNEYIKDYNATHTTSITRHNVYKMIKDGTLKAHKNDKGAWVIEIKETPCREYSTKEFITAYNKKHTEAVITVKQIRELASKGLIKAKKVSNKWVIMESPNAKLKCIK